MSDTEQRYRAGLQALSVAVIERWAAHIELVQTQTTNAIDGLATGFSDLANNLAAKCDGPDGQTEIDRLLVHLQFQDRAHQILAAVAGDMRRFAARMAADHAAFAAGGTPEPIAIDDWLREQARGYTTNEQFDAASNNAEPEITFF